jgi:hypothetical protein
MSHLRQAALNASRCDHAPIDRHQPIPEDEAHCDCWWQRLLAGVEASDNPLDIGFCPCPCHAPAWLEQDASVPDFSPSELEDF